MEGGIEGSIDFNFLFLDKLEGAGHFSFLKRLGTSTVTLASLLLGPVLLEATGIASNSVSENQPLFLMLVANYKLSRSVGPIGSVVSLWIASWFFTAQGERLVIDLVQNYNSIYGTPYMERGTATTQTVH